MSRPAVSIVVPTYNGMSTLPDLIRQVRLQSWESPLELIAVDSGSTDGTPAFLESRVDKLVTIPAGSFDHGLTRNLGVETARGELVVLLVQDAVPASTRWLAKLVLPLLEESRVAGSFARQIPREDASAITRHYLSQWVGSSETSYLSKLEGEAELEAMAPGERHSRCTFDNVCSCIRKKVWRQHPFQPSAIAEDITWGREVLLAGHWLAYAAEAVVIHSHERGPGYEFWRTCLTHQRLRQLFGLSTVPSLSGLSRATLSSIALHLRCLARDPSPEVAQLPRDLVRALGLAVAWPLGQYVGARSADLGVGLPKPRGV